MGIMNGTTNFMLCKMEDEGANYDDVLKEAQVRMRNRELLQASGF
jgi:homoserine dehydrogenase